MKPLFYSEFFSGFFSVFALFFVLFIGVFIFIIVKGLSSWNKNNHSPRLTVNAFIVTKRVTISHSGNVGSHINTTHYYVTFQVESGDRMELTVTGKEYGMLADGDRGRLSFQGTRYLGFERM